MRILEKYFIIIIQYVIKNEQISAHKRFKKREIMDIYRYSTTRAQKRLEKIMNRGGDYTQKNYRAVAAIIKDVAKNGDAALEKYTRQFDAPSLVPARFRVSENEMAEAAAQVDKGFVRALNRAVRQISSFHQQQRESSWIDTARPGVLVGQQARAVDSAGIYV